MMKQFLRMGLPAIALVGLIMSCTNSAQEKGYEFEALYENLPFEMPRVQRPVFADNHLDLTACGGVGDGITLNTEAFAKAIDSLVSLGGGTLHVTAGSWHTGPVTLKDNICLNLQDGALVIFSSDFDDYPLIKTSFEGQETYRCVSPINARGAKNIAITGCGTIDGNGGAWRPVKKGKMTDSQWKTLLQRGGFLNEKQDYWFPSEKSFQGYMNTEGNFNVPKDMNTPEDWAAVKDFLRPVMLSLSECNNVLLEGVTFQNSPGWNLHPLMCENLILKDLTVRNPWYSQNGDGLDLESCKNAIIVGCSFDVGDDAICIKSGKDEQGRRRGMPSENVIVNGCTVFHGHGGLVVGSEMSGGANNISVSDCQFLGTDVGLRFKSTRGRGGVVENIYISNIQMLDIPTEPLLFDLYYGGKSAVEELEEGCSAPQGETVVTADQTTPVFRNIFIRDVNCHGARRAMFFNGLPEMNIENVVIENTAISSQIGAEISQARGVVLKNVTIIPQSGPALILNQVKELSATDFRTSDGLSPSMSVQGSQSEKISVKSTQIQAGNTLFGQNVNKSEITF